MLHGKAVTPALADRLSARVLLGPLTEAEASSYLAIAAAIELPPAEILFLSDTPQELDAAHTAGMATTWLNREGQSNARVAHREARSFDEVEL